MAQGHHPICRAAAVVCRPIDRAAAVVYHPIDRAAVLVERAGVARMCRTLVLVPGCALLVVLPEVRSLVSLPPEESALISSLHQQSAHLHKTPLYGYHLQWPRIHVFLRHQLSTSDGN